VTLPPERLWRAFPWDPQAPPGEAFSAGHVPSVQGKGRFDLPGVVAGVLYLAETPDHAIGELIQHYRGLTLDEADLRVAGHALALASVRVSDAIRKRIVDLCDPAALLELGIRPDETASPDRRTTQRIAATIHAAELCGLRWWSALSGDWHTVVLFRDRIDATLPFDPPEPLTLDHVAFREAARTLGIRLAR
jgi:hypothetical protein